MPNLIEYDAQNAIELDGATQGNVIEGYDQPQQKKSVETGPVEDPLLPGGGFAATTGDFQQDAAVADQASSEAGVSRALKNFPESVKTGAEYQYSAAAYAGAQAGLEAVDRVEELVKRIKTGEKVSNDELMAPDLATWRPILDEARKANGDPLKYEAIDRKLAEARAPLQQSRDIQEGVSSGLEADMQKQLPADATLGEKIVTTAAQNLAAPIAAAALAPVTGGASATILGVGAAAAGQYGASRREVERANKEKGLNLSPEDIRTYAGTQSLLEAGGEALELRVVLRAGIPVFKRMLESTIAGITSEGATQAAQDAAAKLTYKPDMTFGEFAEDLAVSMGAGGLTGGAMATTLHGAEKGVDYLQKQQTLRQLANAIEEDPTGLPSPEEEAIRLLDPKVSGRPLQTPEETLIYGVKNKSWDTAFGAAERLKSLAQDGSAEQPLVILQRAAEAGTLSPEDMMDFQRTFMERRLLAAAKEQSPILDRLKAQAEMFQALISGADEAKTYVPTEEEVREKEIATSLFEAADENLSLQDLEDFTYELPSTPLGKAYRKMMQEVIGLRGALDPRGQYNLWSMHDIADLYYISDLAKLPRNSLASYVAYYHALAGRQAAGYYPFSATPFGSKGYDLMSHRTQPYVGVDGQTVHVDEQKNGTTIVAFKDQELGQRLAKVLESWMQDMAPNARLRLVDESHVNMGHNLGYFMPLGSGMGALAINVSSIAQHDALQGIDQEQKVLETLAHEFGHFLFNQYLEQMPEKIQLAVWRAWARDTHNLSKLSYQDALRERRGAAGAEIILGTSGNKAATKLRDLWTDPFARSYMFGIEEWAAHQLERMLGKDRLNMGALAERFFKGLKAKFQKFFDKHKNNWNPNQTFEDFLKLAAVYEQQKKLAVLRVLDVSREMADWGFSLNKQSFTDLTKISAELGKALNRTNATQQLRDVMLEAPPALKQKALQAIERIGLHETSLFTPQPESNVVMSAEEWTTMLEDAWLPGMPQNPSLAARAYAPSLNATQSPGVPSNAGMPVSKPASRLGSAMKNWLKYSKLFGAKDTSQYEGHLDKYNWWVKWTNGLINLAKLNPHIEQLQAYLQSIREMAADKMQWISRADGRLKEWSSLSKTDQKILGQFLLDQTTAGKFFDRKDALIIRKYPMSQQAWGMYDKINSDFVDFLTAVEASLVATAAKHLSANPFAASAEMQRIKDRFNKIRQKPYFPLSRFGPHVITVKATKLTQINGKTYQPGEVMHFEAFDTKFALLAEVGRIKGAYPSGDLKISKVDETTRSLMGMPTVILEAVKSNPTIGLSADQKKALDEYIYKIAPGQSFVKHLIERRGIEGYTTDVRRSYADYFMHGANHLARIKYSQVLADLIRAVRLTALAIESDSSKRVDIANHMSRHFEFVMHPQNDWASLRGASAILYLGLMVKSALVNLTQVPLVTYPYLASKYGDLKTEAALAKSYKDSLAMYHVTKVLSPTEEAAITKWSQGQQLTKDEQKIVDHWSKLTAGERTMLRQGVAEGWLDESLMMELAALSEGSWLTRFKATTAIGYRWRQFSHMSMVPFQAAEKLNRRTTAMAAYRLAKQGGASDQQAHIAARTAVETTQYEYQKWNRPELLRGKKSVVFMFWQYMLNTLHFAFNRQHWRWWAVMLAAVGAEGLPFAEDIMDIFSWLLSSDNKRVNVRYEARKYLEQLAEALMLPQEMLLHGTSRYGFGLLPWADLSGSLSMGHILPVLPTVARQAGTGVNWSSTVSQAVSEGGGATLALAMRGMQAMTASDEGVLRRIERGIPLSFAQQVLGAFRIYRDGAYEQSNGADLVRYDTDDPWKLAEIATKALGFQPRSISTAREKRSFETDVVKYYQTRRTMLKGKLDAELEHGDRESVHEALQAILKYNREVPSPSLRITGKEVHESRKSRERTRAKQEAGHADARRDELLMQSIRNRRY